MADAHTLVLGIGNPARGDDGAGRAAVRALCALQPNRVHVAETDGEAADVLALLEQAASAFVIDACCSGAEPGAIHRFDVSEAPLPQRAFQLSSHGAGLHEAIELARALGVLPPRCIVYTIEAARFTIGAPMSKPVESAAVEVAARVLAELANAQGAAEPVNG